MAHHQLAHRHERKAQGSFRRCPGTGRRRTIPADQGQRPTTSTRGRGLAYRRTQDVGREETLSRQPAGEDRPAHLSNHHQGALDLRAGAPADERRTRSRPLRGTILARPSPSCAYDDDRLRLPPTSSARNSKTGKKESTGRRLSQLCPPYATPSSNSSFDYRRSDARIVENGFATSGGVSKSAKVVLVSAVRARAVVARCSIPRVTRHSKAKRRPQSICAPEALMIGAHFASSAAMKAAAFCGELPGVGSMPASCRRWITAASASARFMASLSRSTIGCGVPAGARIAFQV